MIEKVLEYFISKNVRCKIVRDDRAEYGDFIAIFGYGDITRQKIIEKIKENDLSVMFFESSIREDIYKKTHALN